MLRFNSECGEILNPVRSLRSIFYDPKRDMDNDTMLSSSGDSQPQGNTVFSNCTMESQDSPRRNENSFCVSKITILIFFLVTLITMLAAILSVVNQKPPTEHPPCPDDWIVYLRKCFYFSENTTTWAAGRDFCAAHGATLAVFNTTKELEFLQRYSDDSQYWIGLSRKPGQRWQWVDGATHSGWFKIIGIGECAYLHRIGISGASSHLFRKWICTKSYTYSPGS